MSFIRSSEFTSKLINNKKDNYGYDFFYDGSNAIVKTYDNDKINNYFIQDNNILKDFYTNRLSNLSSNSLLHRLNSDFSPYIKPKEYINSLKTSNNELKSIFKDTNVLVKTKKKKKTKKNKTNKKKKSKIKNKK